MKKEREGKKAGSPKPSIVQLKEMSAQEYTNLLAREMAQALNLRTKKRARRRQKRRRR